MPQPRKNVVAGSAPAKAGPSSVTNSDSNAGQEIGLAITSNENGLKLEIIPNTRASYSRVMALFGTENENFFRGLLAQLGGTRPRDGESDVQRIGYLLSVVEGIHPRDQLEAMLGAQIAVGHRIAMDLAARLSCPDDFRLYATLTKIFIEQMEALKRYRSAPEHPVTVQNMTVKDGGQAIVGNITPGSGEAPQAVASPPLLTERQDVPMPIIGPPDKMTAAELSQASEKKRTSSKKKHVR